VYRDCPGLVAQLATAIGATPIARLRMHLPELDDEDDGAFVEFPSRGPSRSVHGAVSRAVPGGLPRSARHGILTGMLRSRRAVAAAVVAVTVGIAYPNAARGALAPASVDPTGTYSAFFDIKANSPLLVAADDSQQRHGTFVFTDLNESGNWVRDGATIALLVTTPPPPSDIGLIMVGAVVRDPKFPASYSLPNVHTGSWGATLIRNGRQTRIAIASPWRFLPRTVRATGSYTLHAPGLPGAETLTVKRDQPFRVGGTWKLAPRGDSGNWVALGNLFAMGVVQGPDFGLVFIGRLSDTGISSATAPGRYASAGTAVTPWYATRL
jgi:hypothetical protein